MTPGPGGTIDLTGTDEIAKGSVHEVPPGLTAHRQFAVDLERQQDATRALARRLAPKANVDGESIRWQNAVAAAVKNSPANTPDEELREPALMILKSSP
jgi:hypothetical protein